MKITKDDVGRRVRLRNGQAGKIVSWNAHDAARPVRCETSLSFVWVTTAGRVYATWTESRLDIVELLDFEEPPLKITEADVGRRVRLRNGQAGKIVWWSDGRNHPVEYRLSGGTISRWATDRGRFRLDEETSGLDIVELLDFEALPLKITQADVGGRVRLRDGRVGKIVEWDANDAARPVGCEVYRSFWWTADTGQFLHNCAEPDGRDIVELLDFKEPTLKITEDDVGRQVQLRDGRVGKIVWWDARNRKYTVRCETSLSFVWVTTAGRFYATGLESRLDIVELLDFKEPPLKITEDDVGRQVQLRDGKTIKCHERTETGRFFYNADPLDARDIVELLDPVDVDKITINGTRYRLTLEKTYE